MIIHSPVMLAEVISFVPEHAKLIIDGTLGHWWHTIVMAEKFPDARIIGLDIDHSMLEKAELRVKSSTLIGSPSFKEKEEQKVTCLQKSYADIKTILWDKKCDYILLDLWVNLEHFLATDRGFSLKGNAPLDMRFDQGKTKTAEIIVNTYSQSDLKTIFVKYGDFTEKKAEELAETICRERRKTQIVTTFDLKKILGLCGLGNSAVAVIFQAIRIEVNGELDNLERFLSTFAECLSIGWRCAIMSYHSIEDRLVKQSFAQLVGTWWCTLLTKKVIVPNYKEVEKNKAARSAKLRVIERIS